MLAIKGNPLSFFFIVNLTCLFWEKLIHEHNLAFVFEPSPSSCLHPLQYRTHFCHSVPADIYFLLLPEHSWASASLLWVSPPENPLHVALSHLSVFCVTLDLAECESDCPFINSRCRLFQERGVGAPVTYIPTSFLHVQDPISLWRQVRGEIWLYLATCLAVSFSTAQYGILCNACAPKPACRFHTDALVFPVHSWPPQLKCIQAATASTLPMKQLLFCFLRTCCAFLSACDLWRAICNPCLSTSPELLMCAAILWTRKALYLKHLNAKTLLST